MRHLQKYHNFLFEQKLINDLKTDYINKPIPLPKEGQTYNLPYKVTCGYNSKGDCDALHAFQDTSGKDVGNMNMIVKEWLDYFYNKGINPEVSKVDIEVNGDDLTWTVTISESQDGKAWVGFTSRGAGCGIDEERAKSNIEAGKKSVKTKFPGCEIEDVYTHKYDDDNNGFIQHFIKYTKPQQPAHKSQQTQQQPSTGELLIDESSDNWLKLSDQVKAKKDISIDGTTIEVNLDTSPFTFKCVAGETKVFLLKLVWNVSGEQGIPSATKVIEANKENYPNTRILKQGKFENDTRDWAVVGLIK